MKKALKSFSWWQSSWASLLLAVLLYAVVPSGAAIANERSDWSNELATLRTSLLKQIGYTSTLLELLNRQELSLSEFGQRIEELKSSLRSSGKKISDLEKQLKSSQYSTKSLQRELAKLQDLHEQSTQRLAELLTSWRAYKQEAEKQIREIQRERDLARLWVWIGGLIGAVLGALVGAIFG